MKIENRPNVIEMTQLNQEIITPEQFLNLTNMQRKEISMVTPHIKKIGFSDLNNTNFVSFIVKWKTPRYKVKF